jgi:hypothetical protein
MTAKEKAIELVSKMCLLDCRDENIIIAKQCALICVDEILEFHDRIDVKYWKEVKKEINKI